MSISINNLTKIFGAQKAVDDISFQVREGEIVGFLGPNGAGKSTTMKIATCYLPPDNGSVKVAGYDVVEDALEVRKHIGYLPEHNPLYTDMFVHEYLRFIGKVHDLKGSSLTARVAEMIRMCGLDKEQNKKIEELSKGYRQRVGLAQALIHDPKVLILDEPTTGLDPNQIIEIRQLIENVSKDKTVIFSSHIMQEVQQLCDRVVVINNGKLVADEKIELLKIRVGDRKSVVAEFSEAIDIRIIKELPEVENVEHRGENVFRIISGKDADVRGAIFKLAAEKDLSLIGLKQEDLDMEAVFQELTKRSNDSGS